VRGETKAQALLVCVTPALLSPARPRYGRWAPSAHQAFAHRDTPETWQARPETPETSPPGETGATPQARQPGPTRPVRPRHLRRELRHGGGAAWGDVCVQGACWIPLPPFPWAGGAPRRGASMGGCVPVSPPPSLNTPLPPRAAGSGGSGTTGCWTTTPCPSGTSGGASLGTSTPPTRGTTGGLSSLKVSREAGWRGQGGGDTWCPHPHC